MAFLLLKWLAVSPYPMTKTGGFFAAIRETELDDALIIQKIPSSQERHIFASLNWMVFIDLFLGKLSVFPEEPCIGRIF